MLENSNELDGSPLITLNIARWMLAVGVVVTFSYTLIYLNYGQFYRSYLNIVEGSAYFICLMVLIFRPERLMSMVYLSIFVTCFGLLAVIFRYVDEVYWLGVIPVIALTMLGSKVGLRWSLVVFALFLLIVVVDMNRETPIYSLSMLPDLLGSFTVILIFSVLSVRKLEAQKANIHLQQDGLKRSIEKQQKAETDLQQLMKDMDEVYYQVNSEGLITSINDSILALSGYSANELIGLPAANFYMNPSDRDTFIQQLYQEGSVHNFELAFCSKFDKTVYVSMNSRVIKDEQGQIIGSEGLIHDVTSKKTIEKALLQSNQELKESRDEAVAASAAKSDFLAVMSHELRTPLHGIIGMHDLLMDLRDLPKEQRGNLEAAQQATLSLKYIVNDILDLSKVDAGGVVVHAVHADLLDCTIKAMVPFVFEAKRKDLVFELALKAAPKHVIIDESLFRQVLFNLVGNAVKFTEQGFVKVEIVSSEDHGNPVLLVVVKDSGIGIKDKDIKMIFDPFFQSHGLMDVQRKGTGLGTAIAKRFVELMHGRIWVKSCLGEGSDFSFIIPFQKLDDSNCYTKTVDILSDDSILNEPSDCDEKVLVAGLPIRILLAEDDPVGQRIGEKILQRAGVNVDVVGNGHDVVEKAMQQSYHMILMDVRMPGLDGIAATQKIRKYEKGTGKHIPILGLSAHALEEIQKECLDAGMDDFLTKPFDSKQVLKRVMQYST